MRLRAAEIVLAAEVSLAVHHRHLRLERLGMRRCEGGARALEIGSRLFDHRLLVEDHGFRPVELGLGLVHLRLEKIGVDAGNDLPLAHRGVEVDEHLLDLTRDLRAHLHGDDGVEGAGGRDGGGERPPRHRHRAIDLAAREGARVEIAAPAHRDQTEHARDQEQPALDARGHITLPARDIGRGTLRPSRRHREHHRGV
jgi:hypothetical protein